MTCFKAKEQLFVQSLFRFVWLDNGKMLDYIYYICAEFLHCVFVVYLSYVCVEYIYSILLLTFSVSAYT